MATRILVVDDSAAFRRAAGELLTLRGFAVLAAADRAAAVDVVAAYGCPEGALVDVHLPGDDGVEVAAAVRLVCRSARIVLTSSDVDRVPDEDLARCGAVAFVPKDELAFADLQALLGDAVDRQEARQEGRQEASPT
jgi:CheY-like chemotaxis protein